MALLENSTLLISPSTGTSHIANNLKIPIIWLASRRDTWLWRGDNMDSALFVVLGEPTRKMSALKERYYIALVKERFHTFCAKSGILGKTP